jgi:hypothetical protein
VLVVSGASSVPALAAAVVDHYLPDFARYRHRARHQQLVARARRGDARRGAGLFAAGRSRGSTTARGRRHMAAQAIRAHAS